MAEFVVAIDGVAGSGKSTTARGVAQNLDLFYLDTGAMYRAFTLKYLRHRAREKDIDVSLIGELLRATSVDLGQEGDEVRVYLDREDVSLAIRSPEVSGFVSQVSAIPEVREWMVARQREVAKGKRVVCEGRDIGTVVFPDAQVKIYMEADVGVRAARRLKEMGEKKMDAALDDVIDNLKFRDRYDSQRAHSPLKRAADAIVIDTTHLTVEQEIDRVTRIVKERLGRNPCP